MITFLKDLRRGATIALGFLLTLGVTALVAQSLNEFAGGDLISASKINANFSNIKGRLDNPLAIQYSADVGFVDMGAGAASPEADVPGYSITVTTNGSPIWVGLTAASAGTGALQLWGKSTTNGCQVQLSIRRDGTQIYRVEPRYTEYMVNSGASLHYVPSSFWTIDDPGPGTYTYQVRVLDAGNACEWIRFHGMRMMAFRFHE